MSKTILTSQHEPSQKQPNPNLPSADEFLFMHEFGPFLTDKAPHMDAFIRRLIDLMLVLNAGSMRFDLSVSQGSSGGGPSGPGTASKGRHLPRFVPKTQLETT
jgi:hypothetical protein